MTTTSPLRTAPHLRRPYVREAIAIGVGVGVYGVTFGMLARAAGASALQASALSMLMFNGAAQIALVGVLAADGSTAAATLGALLLAARNVGYGLPLSQILRGSWWRRLLAAQLMIDEPTAMAVAQKEPQHAERAFWTTGIAILVLWNAGTVVGALSGQAIADPQAFGLDVAFPAAFLALLAPQLRAREGRVAAASGACVVLVAMPFTPPGVPVLLSMLGAVPAHFLTKSAPR